MADYTNTTWEFESRDENEHPQEASKGGQSSLTARVWYEFVSDEPNEEKESSQEN